MIKTALLGVASFTLAYDGRLVGRQRRNQDRDTRAPAGTPQDGDPTRAQGPLGPPDGPGIYSDIFKAEHDTSDSPCENQCCCDMLSWYMDFVLQGKMTKRNKGNFVGMMKWKECWDEAYWVEEMRWDMPDGSCVCDGAPTEWVCCQGYGSWKPFPNECEANCEAYTDCIPGPCIPTCDAQPNFPDIPSGDATPDP